MARPWYEASFRRNLTDMHIEDWDARFLSRFDPEEYAENLALAHIDAPMIYLQAHTGHCYWPTKSGHMHSALRGREDLLLRLVRLCRSRGMHVVGYYSLIYNTYEEDRHPGWRLRDAEGFSSRQRGGRYGHLCSNNSEYRAFLETQIREMSEYFPLDGIFYDMLFWPQFCYCPACAARWQRETGEAEMPVRENWADPGWRLWVRKHQEWMGEFAAWARTVTAKYLPGIPVEQNYASGVAGNWRNGACELVNDACDYTGGDLYGDLYNHSFAAKYYRGISRHQPFEYMTCRCDDYLSEHTVTKSEERLKTEVLLTCAHHGASLVIDAIDPVGTQDRRFYERLGRVFAAEEPYEPYLTGELVADAGVYYPARGRFDPHEQGFTALECAVGAVRHLVSAHVPVAVLSEGYPGTFSEFPLVIAPGLRGTTEAEQDRLFRYAEGGGTLVITGGEEPALLHRFGIEVLGMTEHTRAYLAPLPEDPDLFGWFTAGYPMPFSYRLPRVQADGAQILASITLPYTLPTEQRFASIHSNPPGVPTEDPALLTVSCGSGRVVWCAASPEADTRPAYREFFLRLVSRLLPEDARSLQSDAPRQVELVTFRTKTGFRTSAVDLLCTDEKLPVRPFSVRLRCPAAPGSVRRIPDGREIPFSYSDGCCVFSVDDLVMFGMYDAVL